MTGPPSQIRMRPLRSGCKLQRSIWSRSSSGSTSSTRTTSPVCTQCSSNRCSNSTGDLAVSLGRLECRCRCSSSSKACQECKVSGQHTAGLVEASCRAHNQADSRAVCKATALIQARAWIQAWEYMALGRASQCMAVALPKPACPRQAVGGRCRRRVEPVQQQASRSGRATGMARECLQWMDLAKYFAPLATDMGSYESHT